jgi:alpha-glucosidase
VPIPWTKTGPSLGFGHSAPWLPQPPEWSELSVQAQSGGEGSMLELYRAALAVRRAEPAFGDGALRWLDSPPGTLAFERAEDASGLRMVCAVNLGSVAMPVSSYGDVVLASGSVTTAGELPPDTAAWLRPDGDQGSP